MTTTTVRPAGADYLRPDLALTADGDAWGWAMSWWFAIAETLYVYDEPIPADWSFRAGMGLVGPDDLDETYEHEITRAAYELHGAESLTYWGDVLSRYSDWCKLSGLDY
jgi:hypothetical protein